ncbi:MAG: TldD/PmbA family protein [Myxococcales bacterium]|nr:TldD/PmbA family protein [Polyangiaceae bacterium]MDW8249199.1 TldD/PmbA family protein [Myxococcales bacterium]
MNDSEIDRLIDLADDLVQRALRRGADIAECIARSGNELSAKVRKGEPELIEEAGHRAVGLRVIKNRRVALTSTSDLSPEGLERFVSDALELADLSQEDSFAGPADPDLLLRGAGADLQTFDPTSSALDAATAIAWARTGEQAALRYNPQITNSEGATFCRTTGGFGLVLSSGFRGGYKGSYHSLSVVPVADDEGGKKRRGYHWTAHRFIARLDDPRSVGEEAARRTLARLGARKVPTCEAPVIFGPDVSRSILGMLAGVVMGGSIWRKSSYLVGREGTVVASPLITVVDDPLIPQAPGSRPFDGEGLPARRNVVIEEGILRTYLCDSYSARKLGRAPTGSASRGASGGVGETTSNFLMLPGAMSHDELVANTPRGLYVTEMMGFGFNPVTGDFSRGAGGFWIEKGRLSFPVSEVTISLNFDRLLQSIDAVANDLDLRTATAAPSFRVASMTIAGSLSVPDKGWRLSPQPLSFEGEWEQLQAEPTSLCTPESWARFVPPVECNVTTASTRLRHHRPGRAPIKENAKVRGKDGDTRHLAQRQHSFRLDQQAIQELL